MNCTPHYYKYIYVLIYFQNKFIDNIVGHQPNGQGYSKLLSVSKLVHQGVILHHRETLLGNDEILHILNLPIQVVQYCWLNACNSIHSATVNTVLSHIKYIIPTYGAIENLYQKKTCFQIFFSMLIAMS